MMQLLLILDKTPYADACFPVGGSPESSVFVRLTIARDHQKEITGSFMQRSKATNSIFASESETRGQLDEFNRGGPASALQKFPG
jgi:hypothetical protein